MKPQFFAHKLLTWYDSNKRTLPWRETHDPYKIWLSEIILQQTRVNQGMPYYYKFVELFPDVHALAHAREIEVLKAWEGLGYYSRARNLHFTAKFIVENYGGKFPENYQGLLKLKGVGPYTAAAIASFAYGEKVAVVDGNVFRVLSRVFGVSDDICSGVGIKKFSLLAHENLPKQSADIYNQAIMEFGALHCTPTSPLCDQCPLAAVCYANEHDLQKSLPVKLNKVKKRNRYFNYVMFTSGKKIAMRPRGAKDIWEGLYEFNLLESEKEVGFDEITKNISINGDMISSLESRMYKHILTHQTIYGKFHIVEIGKGKEITQGLKNQGFKMYDRDEIGHIPKPVLINNFLKDYIF